MQMFEKTLIFGNLDTSQKKKLRIQMRYFALIPLAVLNNFEFEELFGIFPAFFYYLRLGSTLIFCLDFCQFFYFFPKNRGAKNYTKKYH